MEAPSRITSRRLYASETRPECFRKMAKGSTKDRWIRRIMRELFLFHWKCDVYNNEHLKGPWQHALGASIYVVHSWWGEGSPKTRRKAPNQLICDSDKGREGVEKSKNVADVIFGSPLSACSATLPPCLDLPPPSMRPLRRKRRDKNAA